MGPDNAKLLLCNAEEMHTWHLLEKRYACAWLLCVEVLLNSSFGRLVWETPV